MRRGRPRRTVPVKNAKLGADTIAMLRRVARSPRPGKTPSLDDAIRQLAKRAGVPASDFRYTDSV